MPTFNKYTSFKVLYFHKLLFSPSSHLKIRDAKTGRRQYNHFYITMAKTTRSVPHRTSPRAKTSKGAVRPPTGGRTTRGAAATKKKKLSYQSDDDGSIDPSQRKQPPELLANMPSLVAMPSLPPSKKLRTGGGCGQRQGHCGRTTTTDGGIYIVACCCPPASSDCITPTTPSSARRSWWLGRASIATSPWHTLARTTGARC